MSGHNDEIKSRLLAIFHEEAREHLQALARNLLALEHDQTPEACHALVEDTFRVAHTLKGAARSVAFTEMESICQGLESVLNRLKRGEAALDLPVLDLLNNGLVGAERLLGAGRQPPEADQHDTASTALSPGEVLAPGEHATSGIDSIRVATTKLDALMAQGEELLLARLASLERAHEGRTLVATLARCKKGTNQPFTDELRQLEQQVHALVGNLLRDAQALSRTVEALQEAVRGTRLAPAWTVLDLFPLMVRDLASEVGKEVDLVVHGADLEVDRTILELMKDPLIHLVRNAIDHGIETAEERQRADKAPRGRVVISISPVDAGSIELCVEEDGRGIEVAEVKAAAVRGQFVTADEAEALNEEETLALIFRSGLSTSPDITRMSGHGLGLSIVKERLDRLGGRLRVETHGGAGTAVRMVLPSMVTAFHGLLVRAGGQVFMLPLSAVQRFIRLDRGAVDTVEGLPVTRWHGDLLPVVHLSHLLALPLAGDAREPDSKLPCVIVQFGGKRVALVVEAVEGDREVLVKELGPPVANLPRIAGAGLLASGQVVLVLSPEELVRSAGLVPLIRNVPPAEAGPKVILVVDDSITTRTLERNILESAGYQVRVAVDGVDAWTVLKSEGCDLVVSDVDMPRLDGFELTARIRADPALATLPVILVTALETREDKERGIAVGANAYLIKSGFDQSNLLEIIQRLLPPRSGGA